MKISAFCTLFTSCSIAIAAPHLTHRNTAQPIVDLGYSIHQGTLNESARYYNFSNIRYAEPPLGKLRFAAPIPPQSVNRTINDGSVGVICPQAKPTWEATSLLFVEGGYPALNSSKTGNSTSSPPAVDPRTSEDCLFLDIMVPTAVFDGASNHSRSENRTTSTGGAAVLIWVHGGGYTEGEKDITDGSPAGLLNSSERDGSEGIIFVSINYRLGLFGWLSGPKFSTNGTANAGLYDQRFAFEWVHRYIHLFGGDPNRVTIIGESAGGGSVLHQVTAFGGEEGSPFQQAIPQSPFFQPVPGNVEQEETYDVFLKAAGVSNVEEARSLTTKQLQIVNTIMVAESPYGLFTFGPAVDGSFVPGLPGNLLSRGAFDQSLSLVIGHNANEGYIFTSPYIQTQSAFASFVSSVLPDASPSTISYITDVLYPPIFNGSYSYTTQYNRTSLFYAEFFITCNTNFLARAYDNQTHNYLFAVPPGFHGLDVAYTYYDDNGASSIVRAPNVALGLQSYITEFVQSGNPNGGLAPYFPGYGTNSTVMDLGVTGFEPMMDPTANERCAFWQKALYF